jgi:hypothetical protein
MDHAWRLQLGYSQRSRGVQDGLLDDLLDPGIGDRASLGELVETSPGLDGVEESVGGGRGRDGGHDC